MKITITRLASILLHFRAVFLRLLRNFWHNNDPELKAHFFAHAPSTCYVRLIIDFLLGNSGLQLLSKELDSGD